MFFSKMTNLTFLLIEKEKKINKEANLTTNFYLYNTHTRLSSALLTNI